MKRDAASAESNCRAIVEPLEERRLLSHAGIAVIGDSDSDEYQFHPPHRSTALNYVQLLAESRDVNFGSFTTRPRGTPRGPGYSFNWARGGDTSSRALADGQLAGAAAQVAGNKVSTVIVFIGSDDYLSAIRSADPVGRLASATQAVEANITTILDTLQSANPNVNIVLATVADIGILPSIKSAHARGDISTAAMAQERTQIAALNDDLKQLASSRSHVAIADVATTLGDLVASPKLKVAGATVNTRQGADSPSHFFLADGVHMGTVAQGLLANLFARTINKAFGGGIRLFSTTQIKHLAKLGAAG